MAVLMAASSGGHLAQLIRLESRINIEGERIWLTDRTPQSEGLLRGRNTVFIDRQEPRAVRGQIMAVPEIRRLIKASGITACVSTGAGIALAVRMAVLGTRIPLFYIESATRTSDRSTTGRVLTWVPRTRRFTQYPSAENSRWKYCGSVFDGYEVSPLPMEGSVETLPLSVLVSVGSTRDFGFRRMVDAVRAISTDHWQITWQTGVTSLSGLDIQARPEIDGDEMADLIASSDVVISHAGTGSALSALDSGKVPILVPRRPELGEHIDGHQLELASFLEERGLAIVAWDRVEKEHIRRALALSVCHVGCSRGALML